MTTFSKRPLLSAAAIALGTMLATNAAAQNAGAQTAAEEARGGWIFVFHDHVRPAQARGLADQAARGVGANAKFVYTNTIRGFAAKMPAHAAERVARYNPNIAYYEADRVVSVTAPVANARPGGGGTTQPNQQVPYGITRVNGGVDATNLGRVAWVIDSGIDQDHPDLNVDTARSINFVTRGPNTKDDGNGHGTHVAGTIAAKNNTIGVVGVAAGARVVGVRVLDNQGSGTTSGVIAGIDYAARNAKPGDVANMSLGGGISQSLDDAVIAAAATGLKFALAAGNDSEHANTHSPARANGPNIYTVSAIDSSDRFASFSNFGSPPVDCADPGVSIYSTYKGGGYATLSGTSMATPHLAGVLLLGAHRTDLAAVGDPDGNPDPICVH